jgi:hypothetical protein
MQLSKRIAMFSIATLLFFSQCTKDINEESNNSLITSLANIGPENTSSCLNYQISLTRDFSVNKTTFIWTIVNPNPGNGNNGTTQDLSHWSFVPGCPGSNGLEQNWSDLLSASYSLDGGITWITITPTPILKPDPSQTCSNANVFKFDIGTSGSTPTKYRIVLMGKYAQDANNFAIFKSGARTGCCTRTVPGIGCKQEQTCSFSQGYFFASPHAWPQPGTVTVGGFTYTEAEGRAIWDCSNAGGIRDSKKGFTQVVALVLSKAFPTGDAGIDADVMTIQNWLTTKGKLVACTNLPNQTAAEILTFGNVANAAGRIGDWINANHCSKG